MTLKRLYICLVLFFVSQKLIHAQEAAVQVWAVPGVQKVRGEDRFETRNLVWSSTTNTITVAGARNEHVPFQVVISTPPPPTRYDKAANGFFVELSDLVSGRARISKTQVKLYFEHMVLCYAKSSPVGETGFWPDALVPLTDPFSMATEFRSFTRNRGIWVDVQVPRDAEAGVYKGSLTVTQHGRAVAELRVSLKVYDFALPVETHLVTYMGISRNWLARAYGIDSNSAESTRLIKLYYDFLYANRMEPWFHELLRPKVEARGESMEVIFDDALYRRYLNELGAKRVILEAAPGGLYREETPFSDSSLRRIRSYLQQVHAYFQKNQWLSRLVLNSPIDEPNTAQQYDDTRKWAEVVHKEAPGVPFLVTESPVPDRPEWGPLTGYANNFSVHGNQLNRIAVKDAIREQQGKGGEISWYISCDQKYPQPNYFIDAPAMDPVMIPWITWRYRMNGILYWALNYWPQTPDPWLDPVTFLSGFLCSDGHVLNGEGSLIYPGHRAKRYTGQRNVDGPVSSLRFELLREGIEDYEYLWLLKSLGDETFANQAAEGLVADVSAFSRNVEELFAWRQKIAERIESLQKSRKQ